MKTFEERYTAWIDGQLTGSALTAFEQELARRAEAGDAEAADTDKAAALQLRSLLKEHLRAPALTNNEFFGHQMRERIDAEIKRAATRREATRRPAFRFPTLAWPFARLAGAGVLCLFVAGALYYGTVPHADVNKVADTKSAPQVEAPAQTQVAGNGTPAALPPAGDRPNPTDLALQNHPTPAPLDDDIEAHVVPNAGNNTTATPLHVGKASILWVDGLTYLPDVSGVTSSPAPRPGTVAGSQRHAVETCHDFPPLLLLTARVGGFVAGVR